MCRVLIVDDEAGYRDHLAFGLLDDGYKVKTAPSGAEAIEVGSRFRPSVLVVDWMLKEQIHGLNVSEVLRAVVPELQTILITGFCSRELRAQADRSQVFDFLEKPFDLARLQHAVSEALFAEKRPVPSRIAVFEVAADGSIVFANQRAKELFSRTRAGAAAEHLHDFFKTSEAPNLKQASRQWLTVQPDADEPLTWYLRSRSGADGDGHLLVLHLENEKDQERWPVVKMLLNAPEVEDLRWPLQGRVLLVGVDEPFRRTAGLALEHAGAVCHVADDGAEALRLFKSDPNIRVILMEYDLSGIEVRTFVEQLLVLRRGTIVIGSGGLDRRQAFADVGVTHFLPKPWRIGDLIELLTGVLGDGRPG